MVMKEMMRRRDEEYDDLRIQGKMHTKSGMAVGVEGKNTTRSTPKKMKLESQMEEKKKEVKPNFFASSSASYSLLMIKCFVCYAKKMKKSIEVECVLNCCTKEKRRTHMKETRHHVMQDFVQKRMSSVPSICFLGKNRVRQLKALS